MNKIKLALILNATSKISHWVLLENVEFSYRLFLDLCHSLAPKVHLQFVPLKYNNMGSHQSVSE